MGLRAIIWCAVSSEKQAQDEKVSLGEQERLLRERATQEGWDIVDVLIVPGFSRRFYNLPELIEASLAERVTAPARLLEHINNRDFDIFACRYGSRFAREQSIFGEVVARIIDTGARLFTLQDGWIDRSNYRMYISMGGYAAATEVDKLVSGYREAMNANGGRGLPTHGKILPSHTVVRDQMGKALGIAVNERNRRLFNDLAALLLRGVSWGEIPFALRDQYGHISPTTGHAWDTRLLWRTLHSPVFWGHNSRYYRQHSGVWAFDESEPVPEGVLVWRNTHEAMYTGELAEMVKTELRRRAELLKGRAGHTLANPFSGLLLCGACGYRMAFHNILVRGQQIYRCDSNQRRWHEYPRFNCATYPRYITLEAATEWLDDKLRLMLANGDALLFQRQPDDNPQQMTAQVEAEIAETERRLTGLLLQRADTPAAAQEVLTRLVNENSASLEALQGRLRQIRHASKHTEQAARQAQQSLQELTELSLTVFWQQPPDTINRIVYGLLGNHKIVVLNGEIIGTAPNPRPH